MSERSNGIINFEMQLSNTNLIFPTFNDKAHKSVFQLYLVVITLKRKTIFNKVRIVAFDIFFIFFFLRLP